MPKGSIAAALATVVAIGVGSLSASALALPTPLHAEAGIVQDAAWACGPRRCAWVPGYRGPIPGFARAWGPPLNPALLLEARLVGPLEVQVPRLISPKSLRSGGSPSGSFSRKRISRAAACGTATNA